MRNGCYTAPMTPFEIQYVFDEEDWMAFHKHHLMSGDYRKRIRRKSMLTGALVGLLFLAFVFMGKGSSGRYAIVLILFAAFSFTLPHIQRYRTLRAARRAALRDDVVRNFGQHRMAFDDGEIVNEMPKVTSKLRWDGLVRVEENKDYFFLYTSLTTAIVIPKKKIPESVERIGALLAEKVPTASFRGL